MWILIVLFLICCIVCFGIKNMIISNKLKRAIRLRKFEEADIWLYKRYLFFGNLYITTKYLIYKIEIEFYRGNLIKYDFSEMIIFLNLKKRIINDRALTVLALISINNGDIASAKSLLENCVENKDSAYFYEISLLKNYVFNGSDEFIDKFDAERLKDGFIKDFFIHLLDMAKTADDTNGELINVENPDIANFSAEGVGK